MAANSLVYDVYPPRIQSLEACELALAELGRLDALEKRVQADTEADTRAALRKAEERLAILIPPRRPGEPETYLPLADWRKEIEEAIEKFATTNREAILEDGKKSRQLNHGTFGWRVAKSALAPLEGLTSAGNPKPLDRLVAFVRDSFAKFEGLFAGQVSRFYDLKVSYRKTELLKAAREKEISRADLRQAGYQLPETEEMFYITLPDGIPESQSAEKPKALAS